MTSVERFGRAIGPTLPRVDIGPQSPIPARCPLLLAQRALSSVSCEATPRSTRSRPCSGPSFLRRPPVYATRPLHREQQRHRRDRRGSVGVGRDDLAVAAGAEGPHRVEVDGVLDEPDRAVHEEEVPAARMLGVEGGRARVGPVDRVLAAVDDDGSNRRSRLRGWGASPTYLKSCSSTTCGGPKELGPPGKRFQASICCRTKRPISRPTARPTSLSNRK